ncbi:hypothetical protein [Microbacterium sp. NPDC089696]|uniref:hypothetical protein n=1 Tax=Microbacterium sp. NPDC089696 TaxID=3364199 RepID=UPI00381876BB
MFVSAEIIAVVLSAVGIVVTLGTSMFLGFAWCVRRTDAVEARLGARIDELDHRLGARIDELDHRLGARIDGSEKSLGSRIDNLAHEMTELKIAVARLEGPVPHLLTRSR